MAAERSGIVMLADIAMRQALPHGKLKAYAAQRCRMNVLIYVDTSKHVGDAITGGGGALLKGVL
jgi:hypothetical protein